MRNIQFQKSKMNRIILVEGVDYQFFRYQVDEYGEPINALSEVATIRGIWHESQRYVTLVSGEASTVRSKPSPQIMVLAENAKPLQQGDFTTVDGQRYLVTGKHDPTNLGIVVDISLEVEV